VQIASHSLLSEQAKFDLGPNICEVAGMLQQQRSALVAG